MREFISCNEERLFADTDSATIQNTIAAAIKDGCRKVIIPRYNLRTDKNEWRIDKAIELPSNITLILDNCFMVQETGTFDNMFRNTNAHKENKTIEDEEHDIEILGVGNVCLSGGVHNGVLERTSGKNGFPSIWLNQMFYWVNVRNLRVENLHIENQRHWAMTHIYCHHVKLKNLDFHAIPHVPNMDGIDLRLGCHHFEMENITGRTGDDTIAMTAISGVHETSVKVEGKSSDISDVKIRNVLSDPFRMLNVRILTQDGNQVHDIDVDTVMDISDYATKVKCNAAIGIGTQGALYVKVCRAKQEDTKNITARNIYSRGGQAIRIDDVCSDSTFTNVKTFSTCFAALGTVGFGCSLKDVVLDGVYYGSDKTNAQKGFVDGYLGSTIVRMPETKGNLTVKNVYSDGMEYLCNAGDELSVVFENCDMTNVENVTKNLGKTKIIVNGEEYKGE